MFIWVPPNSETSQLQGLGGLPPEKTWEKYHIYNTEELEQVLEKLEKNSCEVQKRSAPTDSVWPFSIFDPQHISGLQSTPHSQRSRSSRKLFYHYITIVAPMMMPLASSQNPWKTHYPKLASSKDSELHEAVWHAILSQAAAHLLHLGRETQAMEELSAYHRLTAIRVLRSCISNKKDLKFEVLLASILSLIMSEVYEGRSSGWRYHLLGAWTFATSKLSYQPWEYSEMAWLTAQSLCLLRLRTEVLLTVREARLHSPGRGSTSLIRSICQRPDFGFTAGTSAEVAAFLDQCNSLIQDIGASSSHMTRKHDWQINMLTSCLLKEVYSNKLFPTNLARLHNRVFALGTIVYLHRQTRNSSPQLLLEYTSALFQAVADIIAITTSSFEVATHGNITLWPVFMAAVESYRREELDVAESWLQSQSASGIGNRAAIRLVIEEVWAERKRRLAHLISLDIGLAQTEDALGAVTVNWRSVMQGMDLDILLV